MTIAHCPRCDERVSVPDEVDDAAQVRCPLCLEEFQLGEVLRQLPPQLILVDRPTAEPQVTDDYEGESPAMGMQSVEPVEQELEADEVGAAAPFEFDAAASAPATRRGRPARRKKSAAAEIAKVVVGGIVGLTIGQLILWWLPGRWKRDPFALGPKVSRVAPFIVPSVFHDPAIVQFDDDPDAAASVSELAAASDAFAFDEVEPARGSPDGSASGPPREGQQKPRDRESGSASRETQEVDQAAMADDADELPAGEPNMAEEADAPSEAEPFELDPPVIEPPDPTALAAEGPEEPLDPAPQEATSTDDSPQPILELSPREAADRGAALLFTPETLSERLALAQSANEAWDQADGAAAADHRRLAADLYKSLAALGEVLTYVDHRHEEVAESIQQALQLLSGVSRDPDKVQLIGKAAPSWMANRPHDGVCLFGTVLAVQPQGSLYSTRLELASGVTVTLISMMDPTSHFEIGGQVLSLGTMLEDPRQNLDGYQGGEPLVVLDGFHLAIGSGQEPATEPESDR